MVWSSSYQKREDIKAAEFVSLEILADFGPFRMCNLQKRQNTFSERLLWQFKIQLFIEIKRSNISECC